MTPAELHELDAHIAEHVMGWMKCGSINQLDHNERFYVDDEKGVLIKSYRFTITTWSPTTDAADSFAVLKKCAEHMNGASIAINKRGGFFNVAHAGSLHISVEAETLELAVAEFSKKLFQGKEKV